MGTALLTFSIVIVHNHLSGISEPSKEDCAVAEKLKAAVALIGMIFGDHHIIGKESFYSFREVGKIKQTN